MAWLFPLTWIFSMFYNGSSFEKNYYQNFASYIQLHFILYHITNSYTFLKNIILTNRFEKVSVLLLRIYTMDIVDIRNNSTLTFSNLLVSIIFFKKV
jgi:hypothetical protein